MSSVLRRPMLRDVTTLYCAARAGPPTPRIHYFELRNSSVDAPTHTHATVGAVARGGPRIGVAASCLTQDHADHVLQVALPGTHLGPRQKKQVDRYDSDGDGTVGLPLAIKSSHPPI